MEVPIRPAALLVVGEAVAVAVLVIIVEELGRVEVPDTVGVVRLELGAVVVPGADVEPVGVVVVPLTGDDVPDADADADPVSVPVVEAVPEEVPAEADEPVAVALVGAGAADELPVGVVPVMPLTL